MTAAKKLKVATTSLAGCFGCHMSFLDIDERLFTLLEHIEFDRSPLTDIKHCSPDCDIGIIEGGLCNAENVHVLREFRKNCKILIAMGACAINGGLPAIVLVAVKGLINIGELRHVWRVSRFEFGVSMVAFAGVLLTMCLPEKNKGHPEVA